MNEMVELSSYFKSVGLTISGSALLIFLIAMYLKRIIETKMKDFYFIMVLFLVSVICILEYVTAYTIPLQNDFNSFICKFYCLCNIVFFDLLFLLLLEQTHMLMPTKTDNDYTKSKRLFFLCAIIIDVIGVLLFKVDYIIEDGLPYVITGSLTIFSHLNALLLSIGCLFLIYRLKNKIDSCFGVYLFTFITYVILTILQEIYNYNINEAAFFYVLLAIISYFTFQNQDSQLVVKYENAKKDAMKANSLKSDFLANMSHKIRTPLNNIIGLSDIMLTDKSITKQDVIENFASINESTISLTNLIDNILDISKFEGNNIVVNEKPYNISNMIYEIKNICIPLAEEKNVHFSLNYDVNLPKSYIGDYDVVFKSIICVVKNAIDCTSYGEVKLIINSTNVNNMATFNIEIANTGHAMLETSFDKTLDDYINDKNNNYNIKLNIIIAKRYIALLNGNLTFRNERGMGTRYFITFSQKIADANPIGSAIEVISPEKFDLTGKKVLAYYVSNANNRMLINYLQLCNIGVFVVNDSNSVVESIKNEKYDAVILDPTLPNDESRKSINGMVGSGYKVPPILAISSNPYPETKDNYTIQGYVDFIKVPTEYKIVGSKMKEVFDSAIQ